MAVFNVATMADTLGGPDLSLRDAIVAANETLGPDTINVPAGHYVLSLHGSGEDGGINGDLDILESVTIFGAGTSTIIDANRIDRVLHVVNDPESDNVDAVNPDVRIFGVTITGGFEDLGGGLLNQGGTVRLNSSRIEHNEAASNGGAFFNDVHEFGRSGMVVLSNTPVSHNTTNGVNREEALENAGQLILNATSEILDGVDTFFGDLADTFEAEMTRFEYPIIGDQFADAMQPVLDVFQTVRYEVHDFLQEVLDKAQDVELPTVPELIQNAVYLALGGQYAKIGNDFIAAPIQEAFAGIGINIPKFSLNLLKDGPDLGNTITPEDIVFEIGSDDHGTAWAEFKFNLGQQLTVDLPSFDLGLGDVAKFLTGPAGEDLGPLFDRMFSVFGFNVSSSEGIRFDINWDIKTGIGISEHSAIGVYLLSGATENGLSDGEEVEELRLEVEVKGVPTADGSPNLQGQANLGLVTAKVTDGTPHDIKIFSGAGLTLLNDIDTEFDLIINGTETHHFSIDTGGPLPIPALLLYLNGKLLEEFETPLPPLSFTLDFSAIDSFYNPDATSLPSLVLFARDPSISTLEIRGAEALGFEPLQYEDLRGRNLGFGNNTASTLDPGGATQSLVGVLQAPAEGVLYDNPKFDLLIGGERVLDDGVFKTVGAVKVPIFFQEILSRDQLTPLDSLRIKLQETIQTLVGTTTALPVSTVTAEIVPSPDGDRLMLVSHRDPNAPGSQPPLLTIQYPTDERTSLKFVASVDITDPEDVPSLRDDFPNDQRFFNRLPVQTIVRNANDLTQVFPPSVKGHAGIRLHVNMSGDNFLQQVEQTIGIAPGTLGLPQLDFDFIVDVDYDLKNAIKLAYQVLTGQVNPRDLINLDTLLGEIYQISKFQFANIQLDMRHFLQTIVSASNAGFAEVLDPVMAFIGDSASDAKSLLNKRLPVISDVVDENVSMRSIFAGIGIDDEVDTAINGFLTAFDALANTPEQIAAFLDSDEFRQTVDERGKFQFGGIELIFDPESPFFFPATRLPLPTDMAYAISSAADLGPMNFFRGYVLPDFFQGIPLFAGLTLDLVQPQNLMNLILGNPINIVSWGPPKINNEALAEFGFDFGELSFDISAFAAAYQNIRLAYDSAGLERIVRTLSTGELPDFRDLLAGLFIQNNANAPEIGRAFRFSGSGSVDASVFEAEGHVLISANSNSDKPATVGLEIRDPNHDGKLRLDEIRDILNDFENPENLFCIFDLVFDVRVDVGGSATVIIPNPFGDDFEEDIEIDLPIGADISIVDLLGNLFNICQPMPDPPPTLADVIEENGERILRINVGPHAAARLYGDVEDEDTGATISARSSGGTILVSGYGITNQSYAGPFTKIVAIGSRKGDNLDFSGVANVLVELTGDFGNDQLRGGSGHDMIDAGPGDDELRGGAGNDQLIGGSGVDHVFAGLGDDFVDVRRNSGGATVETESGNDTVLGSRHDDLLIASGTGNVRFEGGRGNDQLIGADGDDELLGGDGDDTIEGHGGGDLLIGGRGDDSLTGHGGSDELFGVEGRDLLFAEPGDIVANGGSGDDRIVFTVAVANGDSLVAESLDDSDAATYTVQAGPTTNFTQAETLELRLGGGDDSLTIEAITSNLFLFGGNGGDEITVNSLFGSSQFDLGDGDDSLSILDNQNSVTVLGGFGSDRLHLNRSEVESPLVGTITDATVTGFGIEPINFDATVERLTITLGVGDDRANIAKTRVDALTEVNGGGGDDVFTTGMSVTESLSFGATAINGDAGNDTLNLLINVAAADLATPYLNVGFTVETLEIDNRQNAAAIDWSLDNREVFGAQSQLNQPPGASPRFKLVDAVGADRVVFLVNPLGDEDLAVNDDTSTPKSVTIADDTVTVTRHADVLAFNESQSTRTTQLVSEIDGLDGTIRNVVYSPDGRFVYVKSQTPSGTSYLNQIVVFAVDPATNRLVQTEVIDTPDDTSLLNLNTQIHTDMFLSADGTRLFEARLNSISVYLRDVESGRLLHLSNTDTGGLPIVSMSINTAENVLLVAHNGSSLIQSYLVTSGGFLTTGNTVSMSGSTARPLDIAFAPNSMDAYITGTTSTHGGRIWRVTVNATNGATSCNDVAPSAGFNTIPAGVIGINPQGDRIYLFSDDQYGGDIRPDSYSRDTSNGNIAFIAEAVNISLTTARGKSSLQFLPDGSKFYLSLGSSAGEFEVSGANRVISSVSFLSQAQDRIGLSSTGTTVLSGGMSPLGPVVLQYEIPATPFAFLAPDHSYRNGDQTLATIDRVESLTLSPDGLFAYGVSPEHSALLTYSRNAATGELTLIDVAFDNVNGANGIGGAAAFTVRADGFAAYSANVGEKSVSLLLRDPVTGSIVPGFNSAAADLSSPIHAIAVSPDSLNLFVATESKLLAFFLDHDSSVSNSAAGLEATGLPFRVLADDSQFDFSARDIAISPDSADIYVTSGGPTGGVKHLRRTDAFSFEVTTISLPNADDITLSRDGLSLYVACPGDDSISVFRRNATTGELTLKQTIENGVGGISGLQNITDLVFSTDDQHLFVSGGTANTLIVFGRATDTGMLTFRQRIRNLSAGVSNLVNPVSLLVSPDGQQLYASTLGSGPVLPSVVRFDLLPLVPPGQIGTYQATFSSGTNSLGVQSAGDNSVTIRDVAIPLTVRTLDGDDHAVVANSEPLTLDLFLGTGADTLDLRILGENSDIAVQTEAGDDTIQVTRVAANTAITLDGGNDNDTFRVIGTQILSNITIVGGSPTFAPGDTLLFDPQGQTTTPAILAIGDATVRVDQLGAGTVNYFSIETARISNAPIPSVGDVAIAEGSNVSLSAVGTLIPFGGDATFEWDIDGDGEFDDATGITINLTWPDLQTLGLGDDGDYIVAVRVTDTQSLFADRIATITVTNVSPTLSVIGETSIVAGELYSLNLSATDPASDRVHRWTINWNDGSPLETFYADNVLTAHVFSADAVGSRIIEIQAFDEDGGAYSATSPVEVNAPPHSTGAAQINEGSLYTLNLFNSNGALIDQWQIDWGDNTQSTLTGSATQATHIFHDDLVAVIRTTAVNQTTGVNIELRPLIANVLNIAPNIDGVSQNGPVDQGSPVTIIVSATDPGTADSLSYEFDLDNDGLFETTSDSGSIQHTFGATGIQTVVFRVLDDDGGTSTDQTIDVVVRNVAPEIPLIGVELITRTPRQGTPVVIQVHANDPGGLDDELTYEFDFAHNGLFELTTTSDTAQHVFTTSGPHLVVVRVTDSSGAAATSSIIVNVANAPPVIVSATAVPTTGTGSLDEGQFVTITVIAEDPFASGPIQYAFDFDNNGSFEVTNSTGVVQHRFLDNGPSAIPVQITDSNGATDSTILTVKISDIAPILALTGADDALVGHPYTLNLGRVTDPGTDTVQKFLVDWGDGQLEEFTTPGLKTHTYGNGAAPARRKIRVLIENEDGTHLAGERNVLVQLPSLVITTRRTGLNPFDGLTSLREALEFAAMLPGADTITFGDGSAISGGTNFTDATADTITLTGTEFTIASDVTIIAPGSARLTIDADSSGSVFFISPGVTADLVGLVITNGSGELGGAIRNHGTSLSLRQCTLVGNSATFGAALYNHSGTVFISQCTFSGNAATTGGGGIHSEGGSVTISQSTMTGNSIGVCVVAGTLSVSNSIVAGNFSDFSGINATSAFHNLIGDPSSAGGIVHGTNGNIVGKDTGVGSRMLLAIAEVLNPTLSDNGGPTLNHALLADSPAINAGNFSLAVDANSQPLTTDQRGVGFSRIIGPAVDIGSFERTNSRPTGVRLSHSTIAENAGTNALIGLLSGLDPDTNDTFTFTLPAGLADNSDFRISNNQLQAKKSLNFEAKSSYSVIVRVRDFGGQVFDQTLTISVADINEVPTAVNLTSVVNTLQEDASTATATRLANIGVTDDALGVNVLSLSGADERFFRISNNRLFLRVGVTLNFAAKRVYNVTIHVDDATLGGSPDASVSYTLYLTSTAPTMVTTPTPTQDMTPTIAWSAIPGAVSYDVWITNLSTNTALPTQTVTGTTYTPTSDLGIGRFRIWVRSQNAVGVKSRWSAPHTFVINTATTLDPVVRRQNTPRPTITWQSLPGAVRYEIYVASPTVSGFLYRDATITGTSWTPSNDVAIGRYRAWVRGFAADGLTAAWSREISMIADVLVVPAPTLISPLHATFDRTPTFTWTSISGATQYVLRVRNANDGTVVVHETVMAPVTNFTPVTELSSNVYYNWEVRAIGAGGHQSDYSPANRLFIGGRPVIFGPTGTAGSSTPTFSWSTVQGASRYILRVDRTDVVQDWLIQKTNLTTNSFSPSTALEAGTYRFWVRAVSSTGEFSTWSIVSNFTVAAADYDQHQSLSNVPDALILTVLPAFDGQAAGQPTETNDSSHTIAPTTARPDIANESGELGQDNQLRSGNRIVVASSIKWPGMRSNDMEEFEGLTLLAGEFDDMLIDEVMSSNDVAWLP